MSQPAHAPAKPIINAAANQPPALPSRHPVIPRINSPKVAVLLVNLGTPDAPTPRALGRYLNEFLSDPRVIPLPKLLWQPLLRLVVVPLRRAKSAHAYASIWDRSAKNPADHASPLRVITKAQTAGLQKALGPSVHVTYAMRYGTPGIPQVLNDLKKAGIEKILLAPLYPQAAAATTATVSDAVNRWQARQPHPFTLRALPPYYNHPAYLSALAASVTQAQKALKWTPEVILASFHGLPLKVCQQGDVYYCHAHKTARLLAEILKLPFIKTTRDASSAPKKPKLLLTFQSRFGAQQWLTPYTDVALTELAQHGLKNVLVVAPGFAADCVETLEELGLRAQETFRAAGGSNFALVPCLNASPNGLNMLATLIRNELSGWL